MESLKKKIREIPDFPKPGILFYDITTLLRDGEAFREAVRTFVERYRDRDISAVVGIEARGFIFAAAVAHELGVGFIPVRKPGKLPYKTIRKSYSLEYGTDTVEMHEDAIRPGDRIVLIDDLIATGGTARAVADLIHECGGELVEIGFVIELDFLKGREQLKDYPVFSMLTYQE
jgi:adenine phosphoribosyltransferase